MRHRRLAPAFDTADQLRVYEELMGREALERQRVKDPDACTCPSGKGVTVKSRGDFRTVHYPDCPRYKPYMEEWQKFLKPLPPLPELPTTTSARKEVRHSVGSQPHGGADCCEPRNEENNIDAY